MSAEVVPCSACRMPTDLYIEIEIRNEGVFRHPCCARCRGEAVGGYRRAQGEFAALIGSGVHPKMANRIMCRRIDAGEFS